MSSTPDRIRSMNAVIDSECPICQSRMIAPTTIPACGHTFCFTCLKGVILNEMGCPMCRGPIDPNIVSHASRVLDLKMDVPISPVVVLNKKNPTSLRNDFQNSGVALPMLDASLDEPAPIAKHYWLYQGKNQGWWRFDPRNERDIEEAFIKDQCQCVCEVVICGKPYIVDFHKAVQHPKDNPTQARAVKRVTAEDFDRLGVKGLAGVFAATN